MVGESLPLTGVLLGITSALFVSAQVLLVRVGSQHGGIDQAVLLSMGVNILVFLPAAVLVEFPSFVVTPVSVASFLAAGLVGTMTGRILYYDSIERIGAGRTEPLKATMPLFATVVAVLVLGERLTVAHGAGIVLIGLGVAVLTWETTQSGATQGEDVSVLALGLPLLGAFAFAIEPTFVRIGFEEGTAILTGLTLKTFAAGVGFVTYLRFQGALRIGSVLGEAHTKWYVLAAIANTVSVLAYYAGLEASRVVVVVPVIQVSPLVVAILSFAFLDHLERVTWRLVASSLVIVMGAVTVTVFG
jgi:drug/metabolite transporter (DMT)-like permease